MTFQSYTGPDGARQRVYRSGNRVTEPQYQQTGVTDYQPDWLDRLFYKITVKVSRFVLRTFLGIQFEPAVKPDLDQHMELKISPTEASTGGEKTVSVLRDGKEKKLMVKIPSGVKQGTRIRLRGAGVTADKKKGDLYLHIKVTE